MIRVDIYPVGVLWRILMSWDIIRRTDLSLGFRLSRVWVGLRSEARFIIKEIQRKDWNNLRNTFNGYLAEHVDCGPHNCGTGWTKRAAERRAMKLCNNYWDHLYPNN